MARSKRSKRELRNRRVRKEITEGIRKKQLEDICKNLEETTGVIAGSAETAVKEAVTMGAGEEEVAGVVTIDENTPVDASMFRPTVIGGGDEDDVQMTTSSSTSTKSKKSTKAGSKKKKHTGGSKLVGKKKPYKKRK